MKITKNEDDLVLRIPLYQNSYDAANELIGKTNNLIGVIAGDEFTISQWIDMSYKGKAPQEGMPYIHLESKEELERVCAELGLQVLQHEVCIKCQKVIYGSHPWDGGPVCFRCEKE